MLNDDVILNQTDATTQNGTSPTFRQLRETFKIDDLREAGFGIGMLPKSPLSEKPALIFNLATLPLTGEGLRVGKTAHDPNVMGDLAINGIGLKLLDDNQLIRFPFIVELYKDNTRRSNCMFEMFGYIFVVNTDQITDILVKLSQMVLDDKNLILLLAAIKRCNNLVYEALGQRQINGATTIGIASSIETPIGSVENRKVDFLRKSVPFGIDVAENGIKVALHASQNDQISRDTDIALLMLSLLKPDEFPVPAYLMFKYDGMVLAANGANSPIRTTFGAAIGQPYAKLGLNEPTSIKINATMTMPDSVEQVSVLLQLTVTFVAIGKYEIVVEKAVVGGGEV